MTILNQLNAMQKEAAATINGPLLILAGAGSGKTRTLTYRMAYMVSELGISPKNILAVSFTNKAAQEMRERMHSLIGGHRVKGMTLSTFHALGTKILKEEIQRLGYHQKFSIYDSADQMSVIREGLSQYNGGKSFDRKVIVQKISVLKNQGIAPENFVQSAYFDPDDPYDLVVEHIYNFYQEKLKFFNAIDFDDILLLTLKLFRSYPEVAKQYSSIFKYIMIDEYQDTNPLQFDLIRCLTLTHDNLCVVGDDDQSIYSFRGANIKNILNFDRHYPKAKVIKLEENYRSTMPILSLANKIIKENKVRHAKSLWTQNQGQENPLLWKCGDTDHEAEVVVDQINRWRNAGIDLSNIAIIYRSNTQAQPLEEALNMNNIDYRLFGGQKFYEKKEVKDIIAYLSVIKNPFDELSFRRILNTPPKGIGMTTLNKFLEASKEKKCSLFRAFKESAYLAGTRAMNVTKFIDFLIKMQGHFQNYSVAVALEHLIQELNFNSYIEQSYSNPNQAARRKMDVEIFIESARRFDRSADSSKGLSGFLERVLLADAQDRNNDSNEDSEDDKNKVNLLTMHSSKGLEFEKVFLIGLEEDILPHKKTMKDVDGCVEEERRLFYVGITRAKRKLIMTYCRERTLYGSKVKRNKTRFLYNIASDMIKEQDCSSFEHLSETEQDSYKKNFFQNLRASLE